MSVNEPTPVPPEDLPPVAHAILDALGATEGTQAAVGDSLAIGGGVGLKHYLNLRPTVDLDLWWTREPASSDRRALEAALVTVAEEHGYVYAVVSNGLIAAEACWALWARKQQGMNREPDIVSGKVSVLRHLARIKQLRPIESIQDPAERVRSAGLRTWFEEDFTAEKHP